MSFQWLVMLVKCNNSNKMIIIIRRRISLGYRYPRFWNKTTFCIIMYENYVRCSSINSSSGGGGGVCFGFGFGLVVGVGF